MPSMVTRPVMAKMAGTMRLNWRIVVIETSGWRQSSNGRIATMAFVVPPLSVYTPTVRQKPHSFHSHFGEGIVIITTMVQDITEREKEPSDLTADCRKKVRVSYVHYDRLLLHP